MLVVGLGINAFQKEKLIRELQTQNDKLYEIGTDMGTMGSDFNQMYNLCREENKALLEKDYAAVANLFKEQAVIQTKIEALYSKYEEVPQEIIDLYKYSRE